MWENFRIFLYKYMGDAAKVQGDRKALPLKALSKVLHFAGARAETIV